MIHGGMEAPVKGCKCDECEYARDYQAWWEQASREERNAELDSMDRYVEESREWH